jgi:hypothetical protein
MWVNTWPGPSSQFKALETWITGGGAKLLESIPVTNSRQVDTWQWAISQPTSVDAGNMMYATYADCSLEDGYDMRQVYDMYMDFAIYAQSEGDTLGRKMIVPSAGYELPEGVDFIRLMYSSSISERGTNADLYYSKIGDSEASANLKGFSCSNARSYFGMSIQTQDLAFEHEKPFRLAEASESPISASYKSAFVPLSEIEEEYINLIKSTPSGNS